MSNSDEIAAILEWARGVVQIADQLARELEADQREMDKEDAAIEYRFADDPSAPSPAINNAPPREAAYWSQRVIRLNELGAFLGDDRGAALSQHRELRTVKRTTRWLRGLVEGVQRTLQISPGGPESESAKAATYRHLATLREKLNTVVLQGTTAIDDATATLLPTPPADGAPFSLLDRYPATPAGHVGFLEFVRDEVRYAADAKRSMLDRGYSFQTLESMVRGIKWEEAARRAAALQEIPPEIIAPVVQVLRRHLEVGTVERIDELFRPAITALRDDCENYAGQSSVKDGGQDEPLGDNSARSVTRLVDVYTKGLASENLALAARIVSSEQLSVNEKLTQVDELIPIPPTASAEVLGRVFGVSKTAIQKTDWYDRKRRGKADENTARRQAVHDERARQMETEMRDDVGN